MKTARLSLALVLACAALAAAAPLQARADEDARRGAELYQRGDMKGAARAFRAAVKRRKDDPVLWINLAHANVQLGELAEARKALEQALRLAPERASAHAALAYAQLLAGKAREAEAAARRSLELDARNVTARYVLGLLRLREGAWLRAAEEADAIIKLDERAADAYSLKAQALIGLYERAHAILSDERRGAYDFGDETVEQARAAQPRRLSEAADNYEKYLRLRPDAPNAERLREQIEVLRLYARGDRPDGLARTYTAQEVTTRAVILSKPEPGFTEEARRAGVSGVVRLRVVLGFDGRVRDILAIKGLPYGLTERCVAAARGIRFKPATVNGLPVSQSVILEYNFSFY